MEFNLLNRGGMHHTKLQQSNVSNNRNLFLNAAKSPSNYCAPQKYRNANPHPFNYRTLSLNLKTPMYGEDCSKSGEYFETCHMIEGCPRNIRYTEPL